MNYKIRNALYNDVSTIISLCEQHATYENANYKPEGKLEKLEKMLFCENPQLHCIVAEIKNEIVGYATYSSECSTWNATYYTHMDCLFIKEKYRSLGIGEALVNEIIVQSKMNDTSHIEWQTPIFNERAIKFYNRIGATSKEKLRFTFNL